MLEILYRDSNNPWMEASSFHYLNEEELELMLSSHPDLLPGVDSDALVCRQFETGSGPIDLLIINAQNGEITLVECKLARNSEIRRKIVGQIIDYAAAIASQTYKEFLSNWNSKSATLIGAIDDFPETSLADNLLNARFTLVLAVDEINLPLKEMTIYLNNKTDSTTRVALIELLRYKIDKYEVLTPRTFGFESTKAQVGNSNTQNIWSEEDYRSWLALNEPESLELFSNFIEELEPLGFSWKSTGSVTPSGAMKCLVGEQARYPLYFKTEKRASIEIPFGDLRRFKFVEILLALVEDIPGLDVNRVRDRKFAAYPKIPLQLLSEDSVRASLYRACLLVKETEEV